MAKLRTSCGVPVNKLQFCKFNFRLCANSFSTAGVSVSGVNETKIKPTSCFQSHSAYFQWLAW